MERKWWTLLAVCLATFMLLLDITIVNVALPDISEELDASFSEVQWVIDAYALTLAALLLTAGSLADLLGRRLVFAVGLVCFTAASLLCAIAPDATTLILARGAQGIGGAAMFATSLALLAQEFHGAERGTAFGLWGATTGAAVAVGPLVGGALTNALGWPSIFYLNLPIGFVTLAMTLRKLPESRDEDAGAIDWLGLTTFSAALFLLVFGLIEGNDRGWGSALIAGSLGASTLLLVAFVVVERRVRHPMFDLSLFRKPTFGGASIAAFALSASMFAMFLYLVLYLQTILGYGPLETGLRFLPVTALSFVAAAVAGKLTARLPARGLLGGGLLLVAAGLLLMRGLDPSDDWTALLPGLHPRRPRDRHDQPVDRERGDRRRRAGPRRDGVGHQLDVSPGRHRDGDRRARRGLPEPGDQPPRVRARGHGDGRARRRDRPRRHVGRRAAGHRRRAAGGPPAHRERDRRAPSPRRSTTSCSSRPSSRSSAACSRSRSSAAATSSCTARARPGPSRA